MSEPHTQPTAPRPGAARITARVAAGVVALLAVGFLLVGGALLWGDARKADDGYLSTASEPFTTTTSALVTDDLDVDLGGLDAAASGDLLGKVRLTIDPRTADPVFVGIARKSDVARYLGRTPRSDVTDISYAPFEAEYALRGGDRRATPPAGQDFWAASAHGAGRQTLDWDVADGSWSVVVMNEDASPGVDVGVRAASDAPFLAPVGWIALAVGLLGLAIAAALVLAGRGPRRPGPVAAERVAVPA